MFTYPGGGEGGISFRFLVPNLPPVGEEGDYINGIQHRRKDLEKNYKNLVTTCAYVGQLVRQHFTESRNLKKRRLATSEPVAGPDSTGSMDKK